jgi:hypothetical protein
VTRIYSVALKGSNSWDKLKHGPNAPPLKIVKDGPPALNATRVRYPSVQKSQSLGHPTNVDS